MAICIKLADSYGPGYEINMRKRDEVFVNRIALDLVSVEKGIKWFRKFDAERQLEVLRFITNMSGQAGIMDEDAEKAIIESGLKPTFTPCVLLRKERIQDQMGKILRLPHDEYEKSFILLINLFKLADTRRRELYCKGNCSHEWHNLKFHRFIDKIKKVFKG